MYLVAPAVFFLTFQFPVQPIQPGLDNSWKFAQNYFFAHDIRIGRDVIGTYGPLGFLLYPLPVGANLNAALYFALLTKATLIVVMMRLFLVGAHEKLSAKIGSGLLFCAVLFLDYKGELMPAPGMELIALCSGLVLMAHKYRRPRWMIAAIMLTAVSLLIKFIIGILCLSFVVVYCLWEMVRQRTFLLQVLLPACIFLMTGLSWLILYGDFGGMNDYVIGSLQQSYGYASAMTSLGATEITGWMAAALLASVLLTVLLFRRDRLLLFIFMLFLPGLCIVFKYGAIKQPAFLFFYSFLTLFLLAGHASGLRRQIRVSVSMVLLIYVINLTIGFIEPPDFFSNAPGRLFRLPDVRTFSYQLSNFTAYKQDLLSESSLLLSEVKLSDEMRTTIGQNTVDAYPIDISVIPANDLRWRPRPVFQSYFTYTPWLDRRNQAFFLSDKAPRYLLWDSYWGENMISIDGRYLLNDEPLTILQILNRYTMIKADWNFVLFEKRSKAAFRLPVILYSVGLVSWNEWVQVPDTDGGIVRAILKYDRTFFGHLRRTIYKDTPVFIEYMFDTNEVARCRLVLDNTVSGIWINPFVMTLSQPGSAKKVVAVRILNPDAERGSFSPQFSVLWEFSAFDGPQDAFLNHGNPM